ncbi:MAG: flavin reductase family protein [Sporomusaceae bacterium]|nr:flavin reductase family protein [Sporomusaceae bacterium]
MCDKGYQQETGKVLKQLEKGAFLTTSDGSKVNTMTIAWGNIGFLWGKPVFTILVRQSRYSKELLDQHGEFTVSLPYGDLKEALALCGSKSGRDLDKITAAKLTAVPGKKVAVPVIGECDRFYECKVLYKQTMDSAALDDAEQDRWYKNGDYHTMYYGEIVASYDK